MWTYFFKSAAVSFSFGRTCLSKPFASFFTFFPFSVFFLVPTKVNLTIFIQASLCGLLRYWGIIGSYWCRFISWTFTFGTTATTMRANLLFFTAGFSYVARSFSYKPFASIFPLIPSTILFLEPTKIYLTILIHANLWGFQRWETRWRLRNRGRISCTVNTICGKINWIYLERTRRWSVRRWWNKYEFSYFQGATIQQQQKLIRFISI